MAKMFLNGSDATKYHNETSFDEQFMYCGPKQFSQNLPGCIMLRIGIPFIYLVLLCTLVSNIRLITKSRNIKKLERYKVSNMENDRRGRDRITSIWWRIGSSLTGTVAHAFGYYFAYPLNTSAGLVPLVSHCLLTMCLIESNLSAMRSASYRRNIRNNTTKSISSTIIVLRIFMTSLSSFPLLLYTFDQGEMRFINFFRNIHAVFCGTVAINMVVSARKRGRALLQAIKFFIRRGRKHRIKVSTSKSSSHATRLQSGALEQRIGSIKTKLIHHSLNLVMDGFFISMAATCYAYTTISTMRISFIWSIMFNSASGILGVILSVVERKRITQSIQNSQERNNKVDHCDSQQSTKQNVRDTQFTSQENTKTIRQLKLNQGTSSHRAVTETTSSIGLGSTF